MLGETNVEAMCKSLQYEAAEPLVTSCRSDGTPDDSVGYALSIAAAVEPRHRWMQSGHSRDRRSTQCSTLAVLGQLSLGAQSERHSKGVLDPMLLIGGTAGHTQASLTRRVVEISE